MKKIYIIIIFIVALIALTAVFRFDRFSFMVSNPVGSAEVRGEKNNRTEAGSNSTNGDHDAVSKKSQEAVVINHTSGANSPIINAGSGSGNVNYVVKK